MTAKDIADRCHLHIDDGEEYSFSPDEFQAFARQLLKEQRELCAIYAYKNSEQIYDGIGIENAPEPEFE